MIKITTASENIRIMTIREVINELKLQTIEDILQLPTFNNADNNHRSLLLCIYDGITHEGKWPERPEGWEIFDSNGSESLIKKLQEVSVIVLVLILYYIYSMKKDFSKIAARQKINVDNVIKIWNKLKDMITNTQIRDIPQFMHYFCAVYEEFGNISEWNGDFSNNQISDITDLLILKKLSFS
ncbi:hypothetical protein SteCoe_10518 [Stentor coeruleus]|uniref:Uncharacterized protein n=1 Tax=Stentor coeruleus TaxID=5963 RepID=A0A1R2CFD2_9CILI|nr:hypothetical protein SteCoe_10518 [Stentor coeruleus]